MGLIDNKLNKWLSRKLLVFGLSTLFLLLNYVTGDQWIAVALGYIGVQGIADIASTWKKAGDK